MKIINRILAALIFALAFAGLGSIAVLVHEVVHLTDAKNPYSVCYDIGQNSRAHVVYEGDFKSGSKDAAESLARGYENITEFIGSFFIFGCIFIFTKYLSKKGKENGERKENKSVQKMRKRY